MVIDEDHKNHMRPVVQAFYSFATGEQISPYRIELARSGEEDLILGIADLSGLGLPDDEYLREMIFFSTYKYAVCVYSNLINLKSWRVVLF
jgi:hypothetical protein